MYDYKEPTKFVSFKNCRFWVDDKQNVHCTISGMKEYFANFIHQHHYAFYDFLWQHEGGFTSYIKSKYFMPDTYHAMAKWHEGDGCEWNEEVGKLIAFNKLKNRVNSSLRKRFALLMDEVEKRKEEAYTKYSSYSEKLYLNSIEREEKIHEYFEKV